VDSNEYPFRMKLIRSYDSSSMDDVAYDIVREFWGSIEMIGGSVSVSGKIHDSTSNALQMEVGYFTLIDSAASEEEIDGVSYYSFMEVWKWRDCSYDMYLTLFIVSLALRLPPHIRLGMGLPHTCLIWEVVAPCLDRKRR